MKAIHLNPFKRTHRALSENLMFNRSLSNSSRDTEQQNIKKGLTQQIFNKIDQLQTLISSEL